MASEPFLPNAKTSSRWKRWPTRTFLLWAVLILSFVSIYQLSLAPTQAHLPAASEPSEMGSVWRSWLLMLPTVAIVCGAIWWIWRTLKRKSLEFEKGRELLSRGELDQAEAVFERLARSDRSLVDARLSLGWTKLRRGDLQRAADVFAEVDRSGSIVAMLLRPMTAGYLALTHALLDNLDAAGQWLAEADKRTSKAHARTTAVALTTFARSVVECRQGKFIDVAQQLDDQWGTLENTLTGEVLRPLRVVRAFAVAQTEGARSSGAAAQLLSELGRRRLSEFDYLATAWPELDGFLRAHSL
jgi:hypothetical protein